MSVIAVFGMDHKTASVKDREKGLLVLRGFPGILLATCNRVELYTMTNDTINNEQQCIYDKYKNEGAVRHLFRVAAGLDSQVLGETEILGQVTNAYLKAKEENKIDPILDRLFTRAIAIGRRVRAETGVSRKNVSIAGVAVSKAKKLFGSVDSDKRKIILIGTGKVSESIVKTLLKLDSSLILISNRTYGKAKELAKRTGCRAVRFDRLQEELSDADLIISSTAAPHIILKKEQVGQRKKPLVIIDLAVPRDVDPGVGQMPGITLLNIDDIKEEINVNLARRKVEAVFAERIVEEEVDKFCRSLKLEHAAAV